jgi:hypothetical protein
MRPAAMLVSKVNFSRSPTTGVTMSETPAAAHWLSGGLLTGSHRQRSP